MIELKVPTNFWDDHRDRCPSDDGDSGLATEISRAGTRVTVRGTRAQIECLRSDAAYYADPETMDECPRYLRASASRTLAAVDAALSSSTPTKTPTAS